MNPKGYKYEWLGMSLADLRDRTGISVPAMSRILCGQRRPSLDTLARLRVGLNMPISEILGHLGIPEDVDLEIVQEKKRYVINGKEYTRQSELLKGKPQPWIAKWRESVGEEEAQRILKEASEFGTEVHRLVEAINKRDLWKWRKVKGRDEAVDACVEAWREWKERWVQDVVWIEKVVWSDVYGVAGTSDFGCVMKGESVVTVVDIKTGSLGDLTRLQLGGYKHMYNEMGGGPKGDAERMLVVQLPRKEPGKRRVKEYDDVDGGVDEWRELAEENRDMRFYEDV